MMSVWPTTLLLRVTIFSSGDYVSKSSVKSATLQGESNTSTLRILPTWRRHLVYDGEMVLEPIDTKEKLADVFTKALDTKKFQFLRDHLVRPRS